MKKKLLQLSGKIDSKTLNAIRAFAQIADSMRVPFFVVGAIARDLNLQCFGLTSSRRTEDVDFGICVSSFEELDRITERLVTKAGFTRTSVPYRFCLNETFVDLLPFGDVTDASGRISLPPKNEKVMNMTGFREAYESSLTIRISTNPRVEINVATLAGLAIMKLMSWSDMYPERQRDAEDLYLIMEQYQDAGNFDRLYDKEQALLQREEFDTKLAAIHLLGRDMAGIADKAAFTAIVEILKNENKRQKLLLDMIRGRQFFDENYQRAYRELQILSGSFLGEE